MLLQYLISHRQVVIVIVEVHIHADDATIFQPCSDTMRFSSSFLEKKGMLRGAHPGRQVNLVHCQQGSIMRPFSKKKHLSLVTLALVDRDRRNVTPDGAAR
jgi:hypothetical protein